MVKHRFLSVIGTRPQLMKLAPIIEAFEEFGMNHDYIDTGQHYDPALSIDIQADLGIKQPLSNLKVGSHSHAVQTARIMEHLENQLLQLRPETLLVYGDTNSTLAATLVAVKMGIRVAHIEAGLRSFNRIMPEEINRIATDHLSDLLFCPTQTAMTNLENEGLENKSRNVGDVMCDLLYRDREKFRPISFSTQGLTNGFLIATIHRAENTDIHERLKIILDAMGRLPRQVVLFAHPRLRVRLQEFNISLPINVLLKDPVTHTELLSWASTSAGVITDSGGLQKEAFILRIPCNTLRTETEWPETLENGWNVLITDPNALSEVLNTDRSRPHSNPFGDGHASKKIVTIITS
jgi:UDP-N-acetylglucosamine 2-epimerase (non-hydrolysing)